MDIDLKHMPNGATYEDRYSAYIKIFERIATTPAKTPIRVHSPPWSWIVLLDYLNCECLEPRVYFDHCALVSRALAGVKLNDRTTVDCLVTFRPETTECLRKIDTQWAVPPGRVRLFYAPLEFVTTTSGALTRPEVLAYNKALERYTPTKSNVLIGSCAADKPYPSRLHKAIFELMPDDFYLCNATGLLGLVPQDLWPIMPYYDAPPGVPNHWNVFDKAREYFSRHRHENIVVYCDTYTLALQAAFESIGEFDYVLWAVPPAKYDDCLPLSNPEWLAKLKVCFNGF